MTIAIGILTGDSKIIAVDSAVSTIINDKRYRTGLTDNKCFIKDNSFIFCSGRMGLANKISDYIKQMEKVNVKKISKYAKSVYNEYLAKYPTKKDINLWIWVVDKNHFWQFGTEDNFKPEDTQNKNNLQIKYTGYFEENGKEIEDKNKINSTLNAYLAQCSDLKSFCVNILRHYNCDAVGGYAKVFYFDDITNTFKHYDDAKIDNKHIYTDEELEEIANLDIEIESYGTVKIKKGEFDINSNFIVDQLGNVNIGGTLNIVNKLLVDSAGNLTIHGGSIKWASSDPSIAIAQASANNALSVAQNAQSMANDANVIATSASGNIKKLADGSYIGGTFIDGKTISSPNIEGGIIAGGQFCDLYKKSKLVLNPSNAPSGNADLNLYSGNNVALRIYDEIAGNIELSSYNTLFLKTGQFGTYAYGDWNFANTKVTGLDTVAKFA